MESPSSSSSPSPQNQDKKSTAASANAPTANRISVSNSTENQLATGGGASIGEDKSNSSIANNSSTGQKKGSNSAKSVAAAAKSTASGTRNKHTTSSTTSSAFHQSPPQTAGTTDSNTPLPTTTTTTTSNNMHQLHIHNQHTDTVMQRNAMGEYISKPPLSIQAVATPGPLDYVPKAVHGGYQYTLSGRYNKPFWATGNNNVETGPAQFNTGGVFARLFKGPAFSIGPPPPAQNQAIRDKLRKRFNLFKREQATSKARNKKKRLQHQHQSQHNSHQKKQGADVKASSNAISSQAQLLTGNTNNNNATTTNQTMKSSKSTLLQLSDGQGRNSPATSGAVNSSNPLLNDLNSQANLATNTQSRLSSAKGSISMPLVGSTDKKLKPPVVDAKQGKSATSSRSASISSPGPLAYRVSYFDLSHTIGGKGFKLVGKPKEKSNNRSPGPNIYNISYQPHQPPKYSFGIKPVTLTDKSPGPSDYDTSNAVKLKFSQSASATLQTIGHDTLPSTQKNSVNPIPGPDAYYPKGKSSQMVASLKGRYAESKMVMKTPGPANYTLPVNYSFTSPKYTITGRNDDATPPLTASSSTKASLRGGGSANSRGNEVANVEALGARALRYMARREQEKPGPADYPVNVVKVFKSQPAYSLGAKGRDEVSVLMLNAREDKEASSKGTTQYRAKITPGPGHYDPKFKGIEPGKPQVSMRSRHYQKPESIPGPADYSLHNISPFTRLQRIKEKQLAQAREERKSQNSAANNKKNNGDQESSTSSSSGEGENGNSKPVATDAKDPNASQPTSGPLNRAPGPADYDVRRAVGSLALGPAYSLGKRLAPIRGDETPAPSAYQVILDSTSEVVSAINDRAAGKGRKTKGPSPSLKSRHSPFVLVFPSNRFDTLNTVDSI